MERASTCEKSNVGVIENEVFVEVMGKDQNGRVRGYRLGVSPRHLFGPQIYYNKTSQVEVPRLQRQIEEIHG